MKKCKGETQFLSRKAITICIVAAAVLASVCLAFVQKELSFLERLYYSSQTVLTVFVLSGVIIAVWQYYLSAKSAQTNLKVTQVQRAIDLSEYYKDNILKYAPVLKYILERTPVSKISFSKNPARMNDFDRREIDELFDADELKTLKEYYNQPQFQVIVDEAISLGILSGNLSHVDLKASPKHVGVYVNSLINSILNNMEFFALHFHHGVADDSVVYQPLHQSYIELVRLLYFFVASQNDNSTDKYFVNLAWLFRKWRDEQNTQKNRLREAEQSVQKEGTIVNGGSC